MRQMQVKSLKIITGGDGRKVTVIPDKTESQDEHHIERNRNLSNRSGYREQSFCNQSSYHSESIANSKDLSIPEKPELIPNPYRQCLFCKKEGKFSCGNCKKPYCSQECQVQDWLKHKTMCQQFSKIHSGERKKANQSQPQQDSSYVSEGSSSEYEMGASKPHQIEMLRLSPSKKELVSNREAVVVYYLDYGKKSTLSVQNLFKMPLNFFQYPAQAICCKLVDSAELENITWTSEDTASFKVHTETKYYKAHVLRSKDDTYEVSLLNEDGLSLFSILMAERNAVSCITPDAPSSDLEINCNQLTSVVSDIKVGMKISILPLSYNSNKFFAYVLINEEDDSANIYKVENLLSSLKTEDATMSIEEMDYAAGYSPQYNSWYRCVVLQRKQNKFLVRYVDFGNEEEVEKVRLLTPELLGIKSYLVSCDKPEHMSIKEVEEYFKEAKEAKMTVKFIHNNSVELNFDHKGSTQTILCYPWFRGIKSLETTFKASGSSDSKKLGSSSNLNQFQPEAGNRLDSEVDTGKIMRQKSLEVKQKYKVKVVFVKSLYELFVQLVDDEIPVNTFHEKLNTYCNSVNDKYVPNKNELICCKYSEDGVWYRGQIMEENSNNFNVFFIDFGNTELVPKSDIRFLSEEFRCPKFSICVSLQIKISKENIQTVIDKLSQNDWDMEVLDNKEKYYEVIFSQGSRSLDSLLGKDVIIATNDAPKVEKLPPEEIVKVSVCYKTDQKVFVQKIDDVERIAHLINTLHTINMPRLNKKPMKGNIYGALFDDGSWYRVKVIQENANDSYEVDFIDFGNSKVLSVNDMRELPSNLLEMPPFCRPVLAHNVDVSAINLNTPYSVQVVKERNGLQEVKFLDITPTKETVPSGAMSNSSITEKSEDKKDEIIKFSSLKKRLLPRETLTEILISHAEDDLFYVQKLSDESELLKLREILKNAGDLKCLSHLPDVNDVILAKFSIDNQWYRGFIKKVEPNKCEVQFFDYGNSESVKLSDMKVPSKDCYSFPAFAIPVKFKDLESVLKRVASNELSFSIIALEKQQNVFVVDIKTPGVTSIESRSLKKSPVEIKISFREDTLAYVQKVSDYEDLQKVMIGLQNSEVKKLNHLPKVGELIRVKYVDGFWYRGLIKSNAAELYKVFFVDYGNTDNVKLEDICLLPEEGTPCPMFSIPVRVQNLEDIPKDIDLEAVFTAVLTDEIIDNIQAVKIYPLYEPILESALHPTVLQIEEMCEVVIHHFDEKYYFAQRVCDLIKIKEMNHLLKNAEHQMIYHTPSNNEVLLVCGKDKLWHRCVIRNVNDKQDRYTVLCFDSGVTEEVSKSSIFYLPKSCVKFPVFTIKLSLEEVQTVNLGQRYCIEAVRKTADCIYIVKIFRPITLKSLKREKLPLQTKCAVIMCHIEQDVVFLQNLDNQKLIVELQEELVKCSVAKSMSRKPVVGELICAKCSMDNSWYRGCVEEILPNDVYKILFIDYGNTEEVNKRSIQCLPTNLATYPSFCIPVKVLNKDILTKPLQCDQVYSVIAETEPHEGVQNVRFVLETENIPQGENISGNHGVPTPEVEPKIFFSDIERVPFSSGEQDIVIYFVDDDFLFCAPFNAENIALNMDLIKKMTEYCENLPVSTYDDSSLPEENEIVLAKYAEDGQWYRGAVIGKKGSHCVVYFVDFGNTETLHKDCLRKMPKQFMSLKFQAYICELTGFKILEENKSQVTEELKLFTVFSMAEPLKAVVKVDELTRINIPRITSHLLAKNLIIPDT
ncbi:tudor domain-containing 6-like [Uloborus diversus]|uniref:tudor domain-containing 6-like n=1 Tax=Uloborus diversus TaxID=327109 RepID=UPI00240A500B|nr:tudor domain-containing 6-like [Uloborus diversus]